MIKIYLKLPVQISAVQYLGTNLELCQLFCDKIKVKGDRVFLETLLGDILCSVGDYIIKGVKGEFYPCKPDVFRMTYKLHKLGVLVRLHTNIEFLEIIVRTQCGYIVYTKNGELIYVTRSTLLTYDYRPVYKLGIADRLIIEQISSIYKSWDESRLKYVKQVGLLLYDYAKLLGIVTLYFGDTLKTAGLVSDLLQYCPVNANDELKIHMRDYYVHKRMELLGYNMDEIDSYNIDFENIGYSRYLIDEYLEGALG